MINAKHEFICETKDRTVLCAEVHQEYWCDPKQASWQLKQGYDMDAYMTFLNCLDFEYDNGYGGQELYGTIWYTDGTWSERGEYDGSEWWEHREMPAIPDELKG